MLKENRVFGLFGPELLSNNKITDLSELKAFADDYFNVTKMTEFVYNKVSVTESCPPMAILT